MIQRTLLSLALGLGLSGCSHIRSDGSHPSQGEWAGTTDSFPQLRLIDDPDREGRKLFLIDPLSDAEVESFVSEKEGSATFGVYVRAAGETAHMAGHVRAFGKGVVFEPQFPLEPGLSYGVSLLPPKDFDENALFMGFPGPLQNFASPTFRIPAPRRVPSAVVEAVYPSGGVLPENLLKFYLHFTEPMRRGGVYEFIKLVDDKGRAVDIPFLEVAEELWDPEGRRLTVFIDPGRIKREVKPLEDVGPAMVQGGRYELVISKDWADEKGAPMKAGFRKAFLVGPPDRAQPDVKKWKLKAPRAGSRGPLEVILDDSLDHALLHRLLWVEGADGREIEGEASVSDGETRWEFRPDLAWRDGDYKLVADEWLEDRAGNRIGRPFEVDIFEKVTERIEVKTVSLSFRPTR